MKQARWGRLLLIVAAVIVLASVRHSFVARGTAAKMAQAPADCAAWDRSASTRVATLVADDSAAGELRLDEAIAQLHRARKYCRAGLVAVSRSDYQAIERAIPVETALAPKAKP
jgi:hypothetical protein